MPRDEPVIEFFDAVEDGEFEIDVDTLASLREEGEIEIGARASTNSEGRQPVSEGDVHGLVSTPHDELITMNP